MHKIDIQPNEAGTFDVLVNGEHYGRYPTKPETIAAAREATNGQTNVTIRDFTAIGEGRTTAGVPFAIVPRREPQV
ncbi:MAG: hypothetical protein KBG29_07860 [Pseudomonadales bacterium]|nr:hypothetical protein [Pseudomonadales bacterium]